ncbi:MAG: phosphate ABC transporter permease family protein, partial [Nitrospinae bacterium]|nr:phosphate ABC transporter permease family protein [Nitrospinota bacterium]
MNFFTLFTIILILTMFGFYLGKSRSRLVTQGNTQQLHSLPAYYGSYVALWCAIPALFIAILWSVAEPSIIMNIVVSQLPDEVRNIHADRMTLVVNDIKNIASGNISSKAPDSTMVAAANHYNSLKGISSSSKLVIALVIAIMGIVFARNKINVKFRARNQVEKTCDFILLGCSTIAIFTTIGIVFSVLFESIRFFQQIPLYEFLFGLEWSPQMAIRKDQVGSEGAFGVIPLLTGTLLISTIAMLVAGPIGILSAIYMSEYASSSFRSIVKPLLEI